MKFSGLLDIYNTVKELRQRRVNMVANLEQYIFLHDALLEAVLCGETGVSAQELGELWSLLNSYGMYVFPFLRIYFSITVNAAEKWPTKTDKDLCRDMSTCRKYSGMTE